MKMKKISLFLLAIVLIISVFSTSQFSVQAQEHLTLISTPDTVTISTTDPTTETNNTIGIQSIKLPNAVTVRVEPSETGLTIKVNNIGVDTVDSVSVIINSTKLYSQKGRNTKTVTFTDILPAITSTKTMSIPMVRTKMSYEGSVTISDAGKVANKSTSSSLELSTNQLSADWLTGGGFNSLHDSVDYHFEKHYTDEYIKADTITQYLRMSTTAREEMKDITTTSNNYKVTNPSSNSRKITNTKTKRYILIDISSKKLYSFGGN